MAGAYRRFDACRQYGRAVASVTICCKAADLWAGDTEQMSEQAHGTDPVFGEGFWDERYRSARRLWSGNPNPQLVAEVAGRPAGRALDAGCGECADAIWLAGRGWTVLAADISGVALERAVQHARDTDPAAVARIEWRQVDLLARPPEPGCFDLVSAQFLQLPLQPRTRLFTALAAAVRQLLVVGHHPSDLATGVPRPPMPELFYTPDEGEWPGLATAPPARVVSRPFLATCQQEDRPDRLTCCASGQQEGRRRPIRAQRPAHRRPHEPSLRRASGSSGAEHTPKCLAHSSASNRMPDLYFRPPT
jgi:hypothetical protein